MKMFHLILCFIISIIFCSVLCTNDYNPFSDVENCNLHFVSNSISSSDTLTIFSTDSVTVLFTAPTFVESLTVQTQTNRYFDSTGKMTLKSPGSGVHRILFSFWDTGMKTIEFHMERKNADPIEKEIMCYIKSPLKNSTVSGGFDAAHKQTFKTGSVTDPDVKYQWTFFDRNKRLELFKAETTDLFIDKISDSGYGTVRITDDKHFSPEDTFHYSFEDISPPVLKFLDKEKQDGDTLFCHGEPFYKKMQITDPGCGIVQDVRINGHTEVEKENITKKFLASIEVITIFLRDGSKNHNDTTLKYYVKIDSGKVASDANLNFEILPDEDSITVSSPVYNGFTHVEYLDLRTLNNQLNILANGKPVGSIEISGVQYSYNPFKVELSAGWNSVMVELIDKDLGKAIDTTNVAVLYNQNYKIDKKPTIFDVRFNNARMSNGFLVVNSDSLDLKVIAYDDKGKVKAVVAQTDTLTCENNENQWSGRIPVPLKTLLIQAIDSADHITDTTFNVVNNKRPSFINIRHKVQIVAGTVFEDMLRAGDEDGDKLIYSIIDSSGKNIKVNASTGSIQWKTTLSDVNEAGFLFQFAVSDNIDIVIDSMRVIVHKDSSGAISPVHFLTKPVEIPSDVESGLLYAYKLQFVNRPDSVYYSMKTDLDSIKIKNDTLLLKPQPDDTGYHRVTLIATNLLEESDSLYLEFNVHAANRKPTIKADSLLYKNGVPGITVAGSIDSCMSFTIWIDDPDITDKNSLKTGVKSRFSDAKMQLLPGLDNHYKLKLFNSNNIDGKDTLQVFCEDHGGLVDTLKIPVQYTLKVYPVELLSPSGGEYVLSDTVKFRWNKCKGINNADYLFQMGQSQDSAFKTVTVKDTTLMQVVRKSDTYRWRIITASGRDTAFGQWQYFSLHSPTHIQFGTVASQIKTFCFADVDTYSLKMEIKAGTGSAVRTYKASLKGKKTTDVAVTNDGVLTWRPTVNDTGSYLLSVQVVDDIGNADTLETTLSVVPASGCHISIGCSDTALYCDNAVDLYGEDRETNLIITVDRSRKSIFDTFNISVVSHGYAVNVNADSAVMVLEQPLNVNADDTLTITARNKSNNVASGTEKVVVRYNVPQKRVIVGAGTLALSDGLSKIPVLIKLDKNSAVFTKKCGFRFLVNDKTDTLSYQINSWSKNGKTAEVWVLFDTIVSAGNTACVMEYGYQLPDRSNGKAVFDTTNNFGAVYHFEGLNDKGLLIKDESAAANNGNFQNNNYDISSGIASAISFRANGNNQIKLQQKISIGTITEKTVSFESWVKMNVGTGAKSLFDIKISPELQCSFISETGLLKVKYKYDETGAGNFKLGDGIQQALIEASNEWTRVAFSLTVQSDKVAYTIYTNGLKVASGNLSSLTQSFIDNLAWTDGSTTLGSNLYNTYYDGQYDEVWISKTKRSNDWYKFTFENQKEKSSLIKIEDNN